MGWTKTGAAAAALALGFSLAPEARAEEFEQAFAFDAQEIRIANLIGQIEVRRHSGSEYRVRVHVQGQDASREMIEIQEKPGRRAELIILFPTDEYRRFVYPPMGPRSRTKFKPHRHDSDWLGRMLDLGRGEIEVRGKGFRGAVEVWADVVVEVPDGKRSAVFLGVGSMQAEHVRGDLELNTRAGGVEVDEITGDLLVDTGSGSVHVEGVTGDVDIDTGSGTVDVIGVTGASMVRIDTGSGGVFTRSIDARDFSIDTGSGSVEVEGARCDALSVDTGSGGVEATEVESDGVSIDTGSGGVRLELLRMGRGRYVIDTGSGGIRLRLPREVSAAFQVDTGSGGISVDLAGVDLGRKQRHEARFTVGAGESRVRVSTGSGSIRISYVNG